MTVAAPLTITAASLFANDSDIDGDTLSVQSVGNAANGTVAIDANGDVLFTPDPGYDGMATFEYTASDGNGGTATASVSVTVQAPPEAATSVLVAAEGQKAGWSLTGAAGGDPDLTYSIEGVADGSGWVSTAGGRVRITEASTGAYEYEAAPDYKGADGFDFRVTDGRGLSSTARVDVSVGGTSYAIADGVELNGGKYLSGSPSSSGDNRCWTISAWLKPEHANGENVIFQAGANGNNRTLLTYENGHFRMVSESGGGRSADLRTSASFAPGSWYHVIFYYDSRSSSPDAGIIVDGQAMDYTWATRPSGGAPSYVNGATPHWIGRNHSTGMFHGTIAEFVQIDGQALDASSFGEDDGSGTWVAKDLSDLDYGANGYHLDFADGGALGRDVSGNANHLSVSNLEAGDRSTAVPQGGAASSEVLAATAGNDFLQGTDGADTLSGLGGNDMLIGGAGDDVYQFGRGDAADVVDNIGEGTSADKVTFANAIDPDQLWFRQDGNDLVVNIIGTTDSVTVDEWYASSDNRVDSFETADGSILDDASVPNLVSAMAAFSPPALGDIELSDAFQGGDLDTITAAVSAEWQSGGS